MANQSTNADAFGAACFQRWASMRLSITSQTFYMKISKLIAATVLAVATVGCAIPHKPLPKQEAYNQNGGYIAGIFYGDCHEYGFGIENIETSSTYFMSFFPPEPSLRGALGANFKNRPQQTSIIAVPPGRYQVIYWASYESTMNSVGVKKTLSKPLTFEVLPGRVAVLGKFEVTQTSISVSTVELAINPRPSSKSSFAEQFSKDYPNIPIDALQF